MCVQHTSKHTFRLLGMAGRTINVQISSKKQHGWTGTVLSTLLRSIKPIKKTKNKQPLQHVTSSARLQIRSFQTYSLVKCSSGLFLPLGMIHLGRCSRHTLTWTQRNSLSAFTGMFFRLEILEGLICWRNIIRLPSNPTTRHTQKVHVNQLLQSGVRMVCLTNQYKCILKSIHYYWGCNPVGKAILFFFFFFYIVPANSWVLYEIIHLLGTIFHCAWIHICCHTLKQWGSLSSQASRM